MARCGSCRASAAALSAARGPLELTPGQLRCGVGHFSSDPAAKFIIYLPREASALTLDNSYLKGLSTPAPHYGDGFKGQKRPP